MRIAVITSGILPMPSVLGGAVETILQDYLDENEKTCSHRITVYSCANGQAEKQSLQYQSVDFQYMDTETLRYRFRKAVCYGLNCFSKYSYGNAFIRSVLYLIRKSQIQYDLILVENMPLFAFPLRNQYPNTPLVLHLHNDPNTIILSEKWIALYDRIICVSKYIESKVQEINFNAKTTVVNNCVDVNVFQRNEQDRKTIRQAVGFSDEDNVFVYSGRIIPLKGVLELIKAFKMAKEIHPNYKLLIIGSIKYGEDTEDHYLNTIREEIVAVDHDVFLTGYVDHFDIPKYYSASDIGVIPSIEPDAAPLTAIEFAANGLPIICSNMGGLPEMSKYSKHIIINISERFVEDLAQSMCDLIFSQRELDINTLSISEYTRKTNLVFREVGLFRNAQESSYEQ